MPHIGNQTTISVLAVLAVFTGLAKVAGGTALTCNTNVTVTPALRGEGYTETPGDITITCTGGAAIAPGASIPLVNFTIFYNTTVTSRLLPTAGNPATNGFSEALLLIDEPGSGLPGYGPSLPQSLCTTPLTGCAATVGVVAGPTFGTAVSSGSTPAPNVYQGIVNANSVTFFGVPVLPPVDTGSRVFRMTNTRVNAQPLAGVSASGATPVQASISISGPIPVSLSNSAPNVGYVSNGFSTSATSAASLSQCSSQTKTSVSTLTFSENFATAFKTRVNAQSNTIYAGQINNAIQNIPGAIYNSESNFVFPISDTKIAGLTDFGTRLKATFNNVPAGARIFVSTANVNNNAFPVTAPAVIGGSAANATVFGGYLGYAQLVNGESTPDGPVFFPALPSTDNGPNHGNVPITQLAITNGTGSAVWEVVNTNPNTNESFKFAVYITYTANVAQNVPLPGTSTVNLSFAPTASYGAASSTLPIPRFAFDSFAARDVFTIQACTPPPVLGISTSHTGNFTQGQSNAVYTVTVSNQAGAGPTTGTVTVTETIPSGLTLVSMSGSGWACAANNCFQSATLAGGASYPAITVTVNVASGAASPQVNAVSVSGGGSASASTTDSTVINPASPVLGIVKTHAGSFTQGQSNRVYTLMVSNSASAGPTNGTVTVSETVPSGLTLVSMSGTGWSCSSNTCTRSDVLSPGGSYPAITVTVNVAANASSPQVNAASVSGGGSGSANTTDSTVINTLQPFKIGTYHTGLWQLDVNGNGTLDSGTDKSFFLGWAGATMVTGDWNGDGKTKVGVYSNGYWFLDYDGNGVWDGGVVDKLVAWGWAGATPVVGDWNGDGKTKIGVYSNGFWFLDYNGDYLWDGGVVDKQVGWGWAGVTPIVGDWNGDGKTKIGVYVNGFWFLDYDGNYLWDGGVVDKQVGWGWAGVTPIVGDWNGDGKTKIGVYSGGYWYLDYDGNYLWEYPARDKIWALGWAGTTPVMGDWNGDGKTKAGAFINGYWYLDYNGNGVFDGAGTDRIFAFGAPGDNPLVGRW